jgi:hypothetical protein
MLSEFWIGGIAGALGGTAVALLAGRMWGARKRPTRGAVDICQHKGTSKNCDLRKFLRI